MPDYRDHFTFCDIKGGIHLNSLDYGVYVLNIKEDNLGERNYEAVPIQGRSGNLLLDYGNYNNIGLTITVAILNDAEKNIYALNAALLSMVGYCRLEHSYDLDNYRIGYYVGGAEPRVSRRGDLSVAELKFNCKPQKFLKIGERPVTIEAATGSSSMIVAEGRLTDIMSDAFKNSTGLNRAYPDEYTTVLHTGSGWSNIRLYYSEDRVGTVMVNGYSDKDPTSSSYTGGASGSRPIDGTVIDDLSLSEGLYIFFSTPLRWEVLDSGGNVIDSTYTHHQVVERPTKFPANPLIVIHTVPNKNMSGQAVMLVNDGAIRLSNTYRVYMYGKPYNVDEVYVDCETMNAYMYVNDGVPMNMNRYVVLPNKTIVLDEAHNDIWTNGNIQSAEIIPRWWTR